MIDDHTESSRRTFIKLGAVGIAVAPFASLLTSSIAHAKRKPEEHIPAGNAALPEDDPQAKALHYVEDATTAKSGRKEGQFCQNCQLYSGAPDQAWGPCAIFSYRKHPDTHTPYLVAAQGWCDSWGPRASAR
jgi:hypothetical protein